MVPGILGSLSPDLPVRQRCSAASGEYLDVSAACDVLGRSSLEQYAAEPVPELAGAWRAATEVLPALNKRLQVF